MKTSCAIIKDLLPLYHDGVCSKESKELVVEHLYECEECQTVLGDIDKEFNCLSLNKDEVKPIQAISKEWKKDKKVAFVKGSLINSVIAWLACIVAYNVIGTTILEDGRLVEPFGLIPLFYLFALITLISIITLVVISVKRKHR